MDHKNPFNDPAQDTEHLEPFGSMRTFVPRPPPPPVSRASSQKTTTPKSNLDTDNDQLLLLAQRPPDLSQDTRSQSMTAESSLGSLGSLGSPKKAPQTASKTSTSQPGARGIGSLLARATSVTSGSTSISDKVDRVSGAVVGSVKSAVDSISSQISAATQATTNTASSMQSRVADVASSAAVVVASSSGANVTPVISRQRVVLILDSANDKNIEWKSLFDSLRKRQANNQSTNSSQFPPFASFFGSSQQQQHRNSFDENNNNNTQINANDLVIEQADVRQLEVCVNFSLMTTSAFVYATSADIDSSKECKFKIVRPEFVVVRQQNENTCSDKLKTIISALSYCQMPMLEPFSIASVFFDKQQVFSRLSKIQKTLAKDKFPLLQRLYFSSYRGILNFITYNSNNPIFGYPLVVTLFSNTNNNKSNYSAKIKVDSEASLRDIAALAKISSLECSLEPFLNVKQDILIQKIGNNFKVFQRNRQGLNRSFEEQNLLQLCHQHSSKSFSSNAANSPTTTLLPTTSTSAQSSSSIPTRHQMTKQASLSSSVLSTLKTPLSSLTNPILSQQQTDSNNTIESVSTMRLGLYQRVSLAHLTSEMFNKYKLIIDSVSDEFEHKLCFFSVKLLLNSDTGKEYIVGLKNSTSPFVGSQENQDEDRRAFVELVAAKINKALPQTLASIENNNKSLTTNSLSQQSSLKMQQTSNTKIASGARSQSVSVRGQLEENFDSDTDDGVYDSKLSKSNNKISQLLMRRGSESSLSESGSLASSDLESFAPSSGVGKRVGQKQKNQQQRYQRTGSFSQSILDSTQSAAATAFSSLQNKSINFFRRFDSSTSVSSTPTQSADVSCSSKTNDNKLHTTDCPPVPVSKDTFSMPASTKDQPPTTYRQSSFALTSTSGLGSTKQRQQTISGAHDYSASIEFGAKLFDFDNNSRGVATDDLSKFCSPTGDARALSETQGKAPSGGGGEDTMNQLRKNFASFASIFGDE